MYREISELRGNLRVGPEFRRRPPESMELTLLDPVHPCRTRAEAFVQAVFLKAYQASLTTFYPLLISIARQDGDYAAVAGVRPAGGEALFSEHYLDQPVEQLLGVARQKIVEIGNLAPASAGQARWLIATMTAFLAGAGFTHVVFTAVPRLHNAFSRMGLPLTKQADALRERLPEALAEDWGTYYDSRPAVYSGDIRIGERAFTRILESAPDLQDIYRRAFAAGRRFTQKRTFGTHEQNHPVA